MFLEQLGVYGWKRSDEIMLLASLLTGDPLLLIGNHGCAKTLLANKIAQALERRHVVYDASKAMFEDVLGYPNVEKLKRGVIEYAPSPVTVWDKELILIDEINRAANEMQSAWLEVIRSRKIQGFKTDVKWVWAAMNPMTYLATQALDHALIGRFATFIYPPDALEMSEGDRIRVTAHINGEDAPALGEWTTACASKTIRRKQVRRAGEGIEKVLQIAAGHFLKLKSQMGTLSEFLAKFADLLTRESSGEVALDGRRLGFIFRNILAARSVELALAETNGLSLGSAGESARRAIRASIPLGLSEESIQREEALHKIEICFDLLSPYFEQGSSLDQVNRVYELFTTGDLLRKAELLLTGDLGEMAASKAWNDLISGKRDITILAYTALQVEARRPGTVPPELLEALSKKISIRRLSTDHMPALKGAAVEYIDEVEALLDTESDLGRLIAFDRCARLAENENLAPRDIERARKEIQRDIAAFERMLAGEEGVIENEDLQTVA